MEQEIQVEFGVEPVPVVTDDTMNLLNQQYPGINEGIAGAKIALSHMISMGMATSPDEL